MSFQIIRGNALHLPLEDNSVDLCVTSPPYFGLRSYTDQGSHYEGQLGSEATPAEFVDALIAATTEMVRVVKPSGSIFVNLGDKYAGSQPGSYRRDTQPLRDSVRSNHSHQGTAAVQSVAPDVEWGGTRPKSLMGLPWRYALRCIDDLGLILRAEIIWSKPNGLPESVTDRVRRSHEQWFHMVLEPRYYSAVDTIRETYAEGTAARYAKGYSRTDYQTGQVRRGIGVDYSGDFDTNPLGKLPGSVWSVPTQPLTVPPELGVDHFAAFPMAWPRRIIQGWSPSGICTACGEGRRPVAERSASGKVATTARGGGNSRENGHADFTHINRTAWQEGVSYMLTGEACGCDQPTAPTRPAVVLDSFGGTGTTALVAHALGRHGVSVDMSADYCRLAEWRCNDPGQYAATLQVEKPAPVPEDQLSLFESEAAS